VQTNGIADEIVVPRAPGQPIVAAAGIAMQAVDVTEETIAATTAEELIVATATLDGVICVCAGERVVSIVADDPGHGGRLS
jgi:hypothetical protein